MANKSPASKTEPRVSRGTVLALAGTVVLAITTIVVVLRPAGTSSSAAVDAPASTAASAPARYSFTVVNTYPHDPEAFTQGLLYRDGYLFESTGLNGRSSLRKVRLETGEVVQRRDVAREYFAEGLVDWGSRLIQLTWQSNLGFVYALDSFEPLRTFSYEGEGWGLTRDDRRLIMSDGSSTLRFIDPETLAETGRLEVTERGFPVTYLNELEMIRGEIFANVWQTDEVVVIAPDTGHVTARIDFSGLRTRLDGARQVDVFNGIAWDEAGGRLFVTGKLWPRLFEVRINRN
jgi:glutaminyl-peptide cyclotransferase